MSWLNWDPKSSTRTVCCRVPPLVSLRGGVATSVLEIKKSHPYGRFAPRCSGLPHANVLSLLEHLAFRCDRRRDNHLHVLELGDVVGPADAERRSQGAGEILAAVVYARGAEKDLLERGLGADVDAGSARKVGVRRRHAPVESPGGGLLGAGEW